VGHSLGAALALAYAARYPDDVDALVLVALPRYGGRAAAFRWLRSQPHRWLATNLLVTVTACVLTRRVLGPLLPRHLARYPREVGRT
jgi:pimeloyl-ACP methyl ester carboxylesterase